MTRATTAWGFVTHGTQVPARRAWIRVVALAWVVCLAAPALAAGPIIVNDLGDDEIAGDAKCTLRSAVRNSVFDENDMSGGDCARGTDQDTILFSVSGTIVLGDFLEADLDLLIDGTGQSIVIDANHTTTAIISGNNLTLKNLTFINGTAPPGVGGGAVAHGGPSLTVINCTFSGNQAVDDGGAIWAGGEQVTIMNSTFSDNFAGFLGGALFIDVDTDAIISDSTFSGNYVTDSHAGGGAIAALSYHSVTISGCTFESNRADQSFSTGGAIYTGTTQTRIFNSTLIGNSAYEGGAIYDEGSDWVFVTNVTISANSSASGAAVMFSSGANLVANSIISDNAPLNCSAQGLIVNGSHNISFPEASCPGLNVAPQLNPLANNGGPTKTMSLQPGSPARAAGDAGICNNAWVKNIDQTGFSRHVGVDMTCDIGAYEATSQGTATPTPTATATANPEGWTFCANENQTCVLSGAARVRFGAYGYYADEPHGFFTEKDFTTSTPCTVAAFDGIDPIEDTLKHCEFKLVATPTPTPTATRTGTIATATPTPTATPDLASFTFCAVETQICSFSGQQEVMFRGVSNNQYVTAVFSDGVLCVDDSFPGEVPAPGQVRFCAYRPYHTPTPTLTPTNTLAPTNTPTMTPTATTTGTPDSDGWTRCAKETEGCSIPGTKTVRYGIPGKWAVGVFTRNVECSNVTFSDPAPLQMKHCDYRDVITPSPTATPTQTRSGTQTPPQTPTVSDTAAPSTPTLTATITTTSTPTRTPTLAATSTPTATATFVPAGCPAVPSGTCLTAAKGSLSLKLDPQDGEHKLAWKWSKGSSALAQADFGDPLSGGTEYALCIYDQTGGAASLEVSAIIDSAGMCGSKPCWKAASDKGWSYKNSTGNDDGISKLNVKGGASGKPSVQVQGKGASLSIPSAFSADEVFDQDSAVIVQLLSSSPARCWSSTFEATSTKKNDGESFKATIR